MKKVNHTKINTNIGKVLCGISGAIVGFFLGGYLIAFLGLGAGIAVGHLLEKGIAPSAAK